MVRFQQNKKGDYESKRYYILLVTGENIARLFRKRRSDDTIIIPFLFQGTVIECIRFAQERRKTS